MLHWWFWNLQILFCLNKKNEIENLSIHLMLSMDIEVMDSNTEFEDLLSMQYVTLEQNWIKIDNVEHHICSQGSWACDLLQGLNDQACILKEVDLFGLKLMNGVMCVQAKCNCNNLAADDIALPVMLHELVNLKPCDFIDNILEKYQAQLVKSWPIEEIDHIEKDQQAFYSAYWCEPHTQTIIDNQNHTTFFNEGWDALGADRFGAFWMFCGGLGSAFANTARVESDFNILKWEKDDFWQSMMDLTLEGIFQTKQCHIVMEMKVPKVFEWEDAKYGAICVMKLNKLEKKNTHFLPFVIVSKVVWQPGVRFVT